MTKWQYNTLISSSPVKAGCRGMINNDNFDNLFVKELKGMFNKLADKQQSGLQYPANRKPNDGNFDEVGGGDDDVYHGDDKDDVKMMMMMATKD